MSTVFIQQTALETIIPGSPVPSTSYGKTEEQPPVDFTTLQIDSDDEEMAYEKFSPVRRLSESSQCEDPQVNYHPLRNQASVDATSTSTLQDDEFDQIQYFNELEQTLADDCDASTSCDANSLQKGKKNRSKEEKLLRDFDMWQASNIEVMENLLSRSGTLDDQIKWEAIATARGLCTLTDSCTCGDCTRAKYLAGVTDGDGGLGAAPLFSAINVGCIVQ
ncbi:unnamed protein product [Diatraea saccharalis]|uniref:Uncharacterized protein n=1 Tax=Diatraea saccharalis TaxID=40085 RepID=A0A9N9WGN6_9NEOP|nr:unnamed protein product [Diatraea saccharalis]